jgi:hypothetical protein
MGKRAYGIDTLAWFSHTRKKKTQGLFLECCSIFAYASCQFSGQLSPKTGE